MENKTKQIHLSRAPKLEESDLAIRIACGNCSTLRVFKFSETLDVITRREIVGLRIETFCEKCGHKIEAGIGWISPEQGFSYREWPVEHDISTVSDASGLTEKRKE